MPNAESIICNINMLPFFFYYILVDYNNKYRAEKSGKGKVKGMAWINFLKKSTKKNLWFRYPEGIKHPHAGREGLNSRPKNVGCNQRSFVESLYCLFFNVVLPSLKLSGNESFKNSKYNELLCKQIKNASLIFGDRQE